MRHSAIALILAILAVGAFGQGSSKSQISQLPDGVLSGNTYTNDAVGVSYQFPSGWTATPDVKGPTNIDYRKRDSLANQCSKVLLWLEAPVKVEGRFNSVAMLLAIDPSCFRGTAFPQSLEEKDKIQKIGKKIVRTFSNTAFISPFENVVQPSSSQSRVIFDITGGLVINANTGRPAPKKEPLNVRTSFTFAQSKGYWVAWAFIADDSSAVELQNVKVVLKDPSTQ